jgi:sugar lactone lactonase YvrE
MLFPLPCSPSTMLQPRQLDWIGSGLNRPECVLCTADGSVWVSDWRGGVARIGADGTQNVLLGKVAPDEPPLRPNGIALLEDGSFLLADLSEERAGVWRLLRTGEVEPFLLEIAGEPLPPVNFVRVDSRGCVWVTVSTRHRPRSLDYRPDARTGFVVLVDRHGARVVADELGYANECMFDAAEEFLYLNETFARRLTRYRVMEDGSLTDRETVTEFGHGTFPDGLALDTRGGIWVASIVSNRVIRVAPDGSQELILEENDAAHVDRVEEAFRGGSLGREHLDAMPSRWLRSVSSIAFGGPDLRTVYLGCLLGDRIATFRSEIPGTPPVHWKW